MALGAVETRSSSVQGVCVCMYVGVGVVGTVVSQVLALSSSNPGLIGAAPPKLGSSRRSPTLLLPGGSDPGPPRARLVRCISGGIAAMLQFVERSPNVTAAWWCADAGCFGG